VLGDTRTLIAALTLSSSTSVKTRSSAGVSLFF
jgi:hypothetical protein